MEILKIDQLAAYVWGNMPERDGQIKALLRYTDQCRVTYIDRLR